jgi:hypothetical protein
MKFTRQTATTGRMILANDHFAAIPYDCTALTELAEDGIIPAGTVIPSNDASAKGVLLSDINLSENPNGAIVIHGFIRSEKLPTAPSDEAKTALSMVQFL